ncbi:MAG: hypothetical protein FWH08_00430 [Oscillospiraceae bacterium]|nr:hypothetical protein [Oscillospiraceae bacterium]
MINPLLIARKENADILKIFSDEPNIATPRKQIGNEWSLKTFLQSDLKNFKLQTHFVFDISAFEEQGDEFISLLEGIQYQNENARIIIFASEFKAGDEFTENLVKNGYKNIIAGYGTTNELKNSELMLDDLRDCFSPKGLPPKKYNRFIKHAMLETVIEDAISYKDCRISVAVVGTMSRIGATTYGIHLCDYFIRHGGSAAFVMFGDSGALQYKMLSMYLGGVEMGSGFSARGVDFYIESEMPARDKYNLVIYDLGCNVEDVGNLLESANQITLCGGVSWNELGRQTEVEKKLIGYNYTLAINYSYEQICRNYDELLKHNLKSYVVMPFSPSLFNAPENDKIFENLYSGFAENALEESNQPNT